MNSLCCLSSLVRLCIDRSSRPTCVDDGILDFVFLILWLIQKINILLNFLGKKEANLRCLEM